MQEHIENGALFGWLIDLVERSVHVYRPQMTFEILDNPQTVSGEPMLASFVLNAQTLWD